MAGGPGGIGDGETVMRVAVCLEGLLHALNTQAHVAHADLSREPAAAAACSCAAA